MKGSLIRCASVNFKIAPKEPLILSNYKGRLSGVVSDIPSIVSSVQLRTNNVAY